MADNDPNAKPNSDAAGGGSGNPGDANKPGGDQKDTSLLGGDGKPADGKPADGKPADGKPADGKPADGKPADGKPADGKDKPAEGAPEKYTDFTMPEGVKLDAAVLGEFTTFAKEKNLSQADAQKLVDLATKANAQTLEQQQTRWSEIRQGWVNELKADKEFGGEKFTETVEGAKRAMKRFGDDGFRAELNSFGYGDNAGLVRLLARVDKATREDRVVDGEDKGGQKDDAATTLYPNQGKK